ncbi:MAG: hypothetical protein J7K35_09725 [Syntrophobacterales bacterium]|nr:hypothetical protein [Syntrophobacterales bacterium]
MEWTATLQEVRTCALKECAWSRTKGYGKPGGVLSIESRLRPPEQYFKFETKEQRIGRYISKDSDYNEQ